MLDRMVWWCQKLDLDVAVRHGDTTQSERKLQVEYPNHILITTPEQIQGMLTGKKMREHLKNVKYVVVDELHEIIESKRGIQLTLALERLKRYCGSPQIIALSATVGSPELAAKFIFSENSYEIVKAITSKDIDLKVESPYPTKEDKALAEKIFIGESVAARLRRIHEAILQHRSVLTFTNTREAAEILSSRLRMIDKEFPHEIHHSSLSKEVRIKAEKEFKTEKLKALIATSSLELGIDIGSIDLVLQYMSPRQVAKLVQRVGRSGHGVGRVSKGIIIAADGDDVFESTIIARKALAGELEELTTHTKSLDVLTHQILGLAMESYDIPIKEAYEIIKKAYPYKDLTEQEFQNLINFLDNQLRLIFADQGIKRRRRAFEYYFENLSVIPDSKSYRVIDMLSNTIVGTLDEGFIATHGEQGSSFIVRGRPWKIVSVEEDRIFVEPINDIESSIPAWEGELIPVPYEVSQEVGELRKNISDMLKNLKNKEIVEKIKEKYPVSTQAAVRMVYLIKRQINKFPIPDNSKILIENHEDYVVLHSLFGSMVNDTLSRFVSAILSAELGTVIQTRIDPYRIIFKGCLAEDVKRVLKQYKSEDIQIILEKSLPRTSLFKFRFVQIAKRFGAISKRASLDKINLEKIIDIYWNTPIFKETLNELFVEKLDLEKSKQVLEDIQKDKIKFEEIQGLSPIAELGFRYELQDVAKPNRPEKEIFNLFKRRLLESKVRLLCVNCGKYSIQQKVKEVEKEPRCRICQSRLIAVLKPLRTEAQNIVKKRLSGKDMTDEEISKLGFIKRSADLTIDYGKKAAIVLAGRGIGPQTAARILAKMHLNEDAFYKDILKAERNFIQTKRFWSD
jgi:ATP-dependent Lhr-like helicase